MLIVPEMIGSIVGIYNGAQWISYIICFSISSARAKERLPVISQNFVCSDKVRFLDTQVK